MGLIARAIEDSGIPTMCMSSALSIIQAVNPPRAVYLDFPLGHTSGKANDPEGQYEIMTQTLSAFAEIDAPGEIRPLPFTWRDDDEWKDYVMRPRPKEHTDSKQANAHKDDRVERHAMPQYQTKADEALADTACPTCVFPEHFADIKQP